MVVNVQVARMIAVSDPQPKVLSIEDEKIEDGDLVGSRRRSNWDDEEFEDEEDDF